MTITPAHLTLIRALVDSAMEKGYLTPQPAPQQAKPKKHTERPLPPAARAA